MGKGGKPKIEVTFYYMSLHYGVCIGPPDALLALTVKEKEAWTGEAETMQALSIDQRDLFGGDQKEGGLIGTVHYLPGDADQVLPDALAQRLGRANGADCPGFRGLASLFFYRTSGTRGFYWAANTAFLPGVWAKLRRILTRSDGSEQWYAEKATIYPPGDAEPIMDTDTWRYLVGVDPGGSFPGAGPTYEAEDFDDSGWATSVMPFGSEPWDESDGLVTWPEDQGFRSPPAGPYPIERTLHLRKTLTLNEAVGSITFEAFIDNCWEMWINGEQVISDPVDVGFFSTHTIPGSAFRLGPNLVYIRVADQYSGSHNNRTYIDLRTTVGSLHADMNPAHIIHECLTDTNWGMGTPLSALDDDAFTAAADTLYDETFGLSMMWTRQSSIESFVQEVLDHIQAVLYVDPSTGLLTLSLIRGDYDEGDLEIITPDNADLSNFSRKLWGDITNEIVVSWTNPDNEQDETITVQDDGSIAIQGRPVSDSRNYYGVRRADLAMDLAMRDLRSSGQPLASCDAEVDRSQWDLRPASVIKLTWPEHGLNELVMRVVSVDYGKPGEPTIKLQMIEDVFGLDIGAYDTPPSSEWTDPSAWPTPIETVEIFTLPLFFSLQSTVAAFVESPEYPEVLAGILATTESEDTWSYELWDEVTLANGSTEWQAIGSGNIIGRAELAADLDAEATTAAVLFDNLIGQTSPQVAGFVLIGEDGDAGNEIALIDSESGGGFDLVRGTLDTIPRAWPAGTIVRFLNDDTIYEDETIRAAGETVDYRLRSRTSRGLLPLESAPDESGTLSERPWLPNRPANVIAYGEAWSSAPAPIDARARPDPWVTVSWAIRNRIDEDSTVLAWTDASMTPEDGQTTMIEVRDEAGVLLVTHDELAGTSFDVPDASFGSEEIVRLRVYSERTDAAGDFTSLQYFEHWVRVASFGTERATEAGEPRLTESGDIRVMED